MTFALLILALVAGLVGAAFCAGAETGFFSLNRGRVLHLAREGSAAAKIVESALKDTARLLSCLLVGNNLASVVFSSASAALAARVFPDAVGARTAWTVCAAFTMLALGEFLPKLFCSTRPLRRTLALAPYYRVLAAVLRPLTAVAQAVTGLFDGKKGPARDKVTPDDLLQILRDRKDGVRLTDFEGALIARILVLRKKGETVTPDKILSALDEPDPPAAR